MKEIQPLIDQLGSPEFRVREKAFAELQRYHTRAIDPLRAALRTAESPETQRRLEVIIDKLEDERITSASRVTLSAKNEKIDTILADLCKQAGYTLASNNLGDKRCSIDVKDAPFWVAMRTIADQAGIQVNIQEDDPPKIYAYPSETISPHVTVNGPFQFIATNISTSRNVQLAHIPIRNAVRQSEYLGLSIQIQSEPKVPILGVLHSKITKAIDDKDVSMLVANPQQEEYIEARYLSTYAYRSFNQSFGLNFSRGSRSATTIKEMEGQVVLNLLKGTRPDVVIDDVAKAAKKKFAGNAIDVEITEATENANLITVGMTFRQRHPNPNDYNWSSNLYQRVSIFNAKGEKYISQGVQEQRNGPGAIWFKINFISKAQNEGKPVDPKQEQGPFKLVLTEWITTRATLNFSFKEIPLP